MGVAALARFCGSVLGGLSFDSGGTIGRMMMVMVMTVVVAPATTTANDRHPSQCNQRHEEQNADEEQPLSLRWTHRRQARPGT